MKRRQQLPGASELAGSNSVSLKEVRNEKWQAGRNQVIKVLKAMFKGFNSTRGQWGASEGVRQGYDLTKPLFKEDYSATRRGQRSGWAATAGTRTSEEGGEG